MIEIVKCGPMTTVQDLGRTGYLTKGISWSGAMDHMAVKLNNLLLGNQPGAVVIENALAPLQVKFHEPTRFAITGASVVANLDGRPVWTNWTHEALAGSVLTIEGIRHGMWSYLGIRGGVKVPMLLGSGSTDLKSRFGGKDGAVLKAGDSFAAGEQIADDQLFDLPRDGLGVSGPETIRGVRRGYIRAIPGREHDAFTEEAISKFWGAPWSISTKSNRMGYRLEGPELTWKEKLELLSYGLLPGVVQVPPSGQPLVQLSEANTCGGYSSIATVITADLWRLAQLRWGEPVHFVKVSHQEAIAALANDEDYLTQVRLGLSLRTRQST